jgi:type VI secretion system secreted protein VgrG
LWNLTRTADCRIFQDKTVPEIIEQIFEDLGYSSGNDYKLKLTGTYEPRTYCVQYRETDFDFVSRLMEEEGIFYFFEHSTDGHVMVLGDSAQACPPCPEDSGFTYGPERGEVRTDAVTSWVYEQEVCPAEYTHTDYNFETPSTDLKVSAPTVAEVGRNDKLEIYDYPGEYLEPAEGDRYAKLRMEEQETMREALGDATIEWVKRNTPADADEWVDRFVEEARVAVEMNPLGASWIEETDCTELAHWFER